MRKALPTLFLATASLAQASPVDFSVSGSLREDPNCLVGASLTSMDEGKYLIECATLAVRAQIDRKASEKIRARKAISGQFSGFHLGELIVITEIQSF